MVGRGEERLAARVRDTEYARNRRNRPSPAKRQKYFKAVVRHISQWLEPGWVGGGNPEKNENIKLNLYLDTCWLKHLEEISW